MMKKKICTLKNLLGSLDEKEIYINPTGNFVIGGPDGDSGLLEEKLLLILMVEPHHMEEVHFPVKIQQKSIDQLLMHQDI